MRGVPTIGAAVMALSATPAYACTLCHSRIAEDVRATVFGPGFWGDAATLVSPVPLLVTAVVVMRRYLP
jgi:hypothetical protein